ncbi:hypothetical protein MIMGU_mgv1a017904mg [Erythranthe guttata]|uniref:Secreted protein n=1 Tax=Erythranthe guttata TaxID=4155 RepID=A0A022PNE3_ERYGU|nr:hypothetical protein MIMGU_mgv1a017904mg [Erythranthe guttata]
MLKILILILIRVSTILQLRQLAHGGGHLLSKSVVCHIQLLHAPHTANHPHIKPRQLLQQPNLWRQAPRQTVVHHNQLVKHLPHLFNTPWNTPPEIVVRQNQNRHRRLPQILRYVQLELIVVEKNGNTLFKFIEPEIQEFQRRQRKHYCQKPANEPVVAQI